MSETNETAEQKTKGFIYDLKHGQSSDHWRDIELGEKSEQIIRVFMRVEALELALKPFAALPDQFVSTAPDTHWAAVQVRLGHLRNAKKVLEDKV